MHACHATAALRLAELRKAKSVKLVGVWIDSFIHMNGTGWDGDQCACGNSHAIGKCERAQRQTEEGNWIEARSKSVCCTWDAGEGIQRTDGETINPLGLPDETVDLAHLVYPSFCPTFFSNYCVDLFAEGFHVFRTRKKTVQYLRERLLT